MNNAVAYLDESAAGWERGLYAFLAEKERRSSSTRTVQSYSRMLNHFFGQTGSLIRSLRRTSLPGPTARGSQEGSQAL